MPRVKKHTVLFNQKLIVEEAVIVSGNDEYTRLRVKREDASAVLIFNVDNQTVILTKQFRYPVCDTIKDPFPEILAGKVDAGETHLDAAIREAKEETGYCIGHENIRLLVSCYSTPGYSSEKFYIYFATVANSDRQAEGGGRKEENEEIEVVELNVNQFAEDIKKGRFNDAKTIIAGFYALKYLDMGLSDHSPHFRD